MPSLQDTKFYIVREDGSVIMDFYLTPEGKLDGTDIRDPNDLLFRLNKQLDSEQRGRVLFGKPKIGGSNAVGT